MNVIGIRQLNKGQCHNVLGMALVKFQFDPEKYASMDQNKYKFIEDFNVEKYCLLLRILSRVHLKVSLL